LFVLTLQKITPWIRILIPIQIPIYFLKTLDSDPDPHEMDADPKAWLDSGSYTPNPSMRREPQASAGPSAPLIKSIEPPPSNV